MLKRSMASRTAMKTGLAASPPWQTLCQCRARRSRRQQALVAREGFVVGEIVGLAHEGVDGADGVAARHGKGDEGVVEIFGFAVGDGPAGCVGVVKHVTVSCLALVVKRPSP